jgi:hypothetical protein
MWYGAELVIIVKHQMSSLLSTSWGKQDTFDEMIMMSALFLTNTLSWILIVLAHWNKSLPKTCRFTQTHYSSSEPTSLCLYSLVLLSREAIHTNFIVFGLTWPGLEPRSTRTTPHVVKIDIGELNTNEN